jgi:2,5-diamino-6-(ribosylamino)-4(3H)-pyrimidinone 5'-phosphate reductase
MRPRVIVNCAMSADGKIASRARKQTRLSDEKDMARVHRLRNECDAILIGIGTVMADDPSLLVKKKYIEGKVRQPVRIVLDSRCRIPKSAKVLAGSAKTILAVTENHAKKVGNAEVLACGKGKRVDLNILLDKLAKRGVKKVLVEGGGETIWSFVKAGLVDTFIVFIGSRLIGGRSAPTPMDGEGFASEEEFAMLALKKTTITEGGILLEFRVE